MYVQKLRIITVYKSYNMTALYHTAEFTLSQSIALNPLYCTVIDTHCTIMILSFRTDGPGQTVQTQIEWQKKCGSGSTLFFCNSLCIFWMHYSKVKPPCSTFRVITANIRVSEFLGILWYVTFTTQKRTKFL